MITDEVIRIANETAGQHWMDEAHIQRFAKAVIDASMPAIKLAMKAERENGAREERERCEELWESLRISDRQIQETIEASIAAERERCAKLVEDMDMRHSWKYADMLRRGVSE